MLLAGEISGDTLAAELVHALRRCLAHQPVPPHFLAAGGPRLAHAGAHLALDLTAHAVIGLWEVLRRLRTFRSLLHRLLDLACTAQPDVIVCVDFAGFNRRFAHALRQRLRSTPRPFHNWHPRLVQFVSPQVWASRPGRARAMAQDFDLLLSIFPFEPDWYARHAPDLNVTFVGHPLLDRYGPPPRPPDHPSNVVLLPGSRVGELHRHLPVLLQAWTQLRQTHPHLHGTIVLPNDSLAQLAATFHPPPELTLQTGGLASTLQHAALALASTGTVTLECAYFGVPTVTLYRTSWTTYHIAKRLITVPFLAMPNLLARDAVFPEFIQHQATPDNLARAAAQFLDDPEHCARLRRQLATVVASLGPPGAAHRAAQAILGLFP